MEKLTKREMKLQENDKKNEEYLKEFVTWLNSKSLSSKTIKKHIENADVYLNYYLTNSNVIPMEYGWDQTYTFLSDWGIRKNLFISKTSLKETATSIKKFYEYMSEKWLY